MLNVYFRQKFNFEQTNHEIFDQQNEITIFFVIS